MKIQKKKITIGGIQQSGKTYFARNKLVPQFRRPLLYEVNPDYRECKNLLIYKPKNLSPELLNEFCEKVKALAIAGKIDAFILDEADMFFTNNIGQLNHLNDLVINHAHYDLALIFITRRPQDIPAKIVESSHILIMFKVEGKNVFDRLRGISEELEEAVKKLDYEKRNYVIKEIGQHPVIHNHLP